MYELTVAIHRLLQLESWPFCVLYVAICPKSLIGADGGPSLQKQCALAKAALGKQQIENAITHNAFLCAVLMRMVDRGFMRGTLLRGIELNRADTIARTQLRQGSR
jgi:hypothetical protein